MAKIKRKNTDIDKLFVSSNQGFIVLFCFCFFILGGSPLKRLSHHYKQLIICKC